MCGGTNDCDDHNNDTGSHNDGTGSRGRGDPSAAASSHRNSDGNTWTGIRLDERLLAMDRNNLRVGGGNLGSSPTTSRSLGGRPLDASCGWLGMDSRPLAVAQEDSNCYQPRIFAKISGATIVASDSMTYFGVSMLSFPHVIFSLGTAPEYDPKLVVESLIWQK